MKTWQRFLASLIMVVMLVTVSVPLTIAEAPVIIEEIVTEPTEEPVVEATEEPVAEATEEPVAEATEEPVAEATEEPVVEATEEPIVEATEEPVVEATEEPVVEATEEPVVEATEEPAVEATEEPAVEATEEPVVEATEEPVVEATEEPVVEATEEPVVEATEEPVVEATEEPAVEATEEPAVEATEEPVVEATEEPVVEATEEPIVEATEEPEAPVVTPEPVVFEPIYAWIDSGIEVWNDVPGTDKLGDVDKTGVVLMQPVDGELYTYAITFDTEDTVYDPECITGYVIIDADEEIDWLDEAETLAYLEELTIYRLDDDTVIPVIEFDFEPKCEMEEHSHLAECCDEAGELICELPEHEHDADCRFAPEPVVVPEPTEEPAAEEPEAPEIEVFEDAAEAGCEVLYVYCGGGIAKKDTGIMVNTAAGATHVKMNVGDEEVIWTADNAEVTDYGNYMEWQIKHVFEWSGDYALSYQASADAETWGNEYWAETIKIKDADVLYVYCAGGIAKKSIAIMVNTNASVTSLKMKAGSDEVIWNQGDEGVTVEDYGTYKVWEVKHTFEWAGEYSLCYQGSSDGSTFNEEYWADPITLKDADVLYVYCAGGIAKNPAAIMVNTNASVISLKMKIGEEEVVWNQGDEGVTVEDYGTYKVWEVKHTFEWAGEYSLCYQGSSDGSTFNEEYWADPISFKDADVLYVYCANGIAKKTAAIMVNTNASVISLKMKIGEEEVVWNQGDEGVTVEDYGTYKVWEVKHTFEWAGEYSLCYQGSSDGVTFNEEYWADPVSFKDADVLYVYCAGGVKNEETLITVDTNATITSLKMKIGEEEVIWNQGDEGVTVEDYGTYKVWKVYHVFGWTGDYGLCYQGSADGETWGEEYWADTFTIEEPAIISASVSAYAAEIGEELTINVVTNSNMQFLKIYEGENLLVDLQAADAQIVETENGKEWVVAYAFENAGEYYLRYEVSADGTETDGSYTEEQPVVVTSAAMVYGDFEYVYNEDETGVVITKYNGTDSQVTVPATIDELPVVKIGESAFEGNTALTSIDLPDSVEVIGKRAFANCTSLSEMN